MKVEGKKSSFPGSTRQPEKGTKVGATATDRRRRLSIPDTIPTQDEQPLKDGSNLVTVKQEISRKGAKLCNGSVKGIHEDLFKTLGIGFCEENQMNLFANTLINEIQTRVIEALSKHTGISISTATKTQSTSSNPTGTYMHQSASFMPLLLLAFLKVFSMGREVLIIL